MQPVLRADCDRYTILDHDMGMCTVSVTHLKPAQSTRGHKHGWEECYYIANGLGRMQIGEKTKEVSMGQFKLIPPGVYHRVFNKGFMTLSFVCVWKNKEAAE